MSQFTLPEFVPPTRRFTPHCTASDRARKAKRVRDVAEADIQAMAMLEAMSGDREAVAVDGADALALQLGGSSVQKGLGEDEHVPVDDVMKRMRTEDRQHHDQQAANLLASSSWSLAAAPPTSTSSAAFSAAPPLTWRKPLIAKAAPRPGVPGLRDEGSDSDSDDDVVDKGSCGATPAFNQKLCSGIRTIQEKALQEIAAEAARTFPDYDSFALAYLDPDFKMTIRQQIDRFVALARTRPVLASVQEKYMRNDVVDHIVLGRMFARDQDITDDPPEHVRAVRAALEAARATNHPAP